MSDEFEYLDLRLHPCEEFKGKLIALNGRDYMLIDEIGSGGEGTVFVLMNMMSRLTPLVAKIYHFLAGSPEYEQTRARLPRIMFSVGLAESDGLVPEADYEMCGGLIGIQQYVGFIPTDLSFPDLLNRSAARLKEGQPNEAVAICDQILEANPSHAAALCNKAAGLAQQGALGDAIRCMAEAVEIEPNDPRLARGLAGFLADAGRVDTALTVLRDALQRWRWDGRTWQELARLAIEFDRTDIVSKELQYGLDISPANLADVRVRIEESGKRRAHYERELEMAIAAQRSHDWPRALEALRRARDASKGDELAILNEQICLAHQKEWTGVADTALSLIQRLAGAAQLAAALIAMLALDATGELDGARSAALYLAQMVADPIDLPRIPIFISPQMAVEDPEVENILAIILRIREHDTSNRENERALDRLAQQYRELDRITRETRDDA